jgi:hypothetical protein
VGLRVVPSHLQVQHFTWSALQHLKWSTGDRLLTVADALALVQQQVELVIIDVKASPDVNRVGAVCSVLCCVVLPSAMRLVWVRGPTNCSVAVIASLASYVACARRVVTTLFLAAACSVQHKFTPKGD